MKTIIDGKRYDTGRAELLAEYTFGYSSDLRYVSEGLYRTSKGAYFLHAEGGALSKYGVSVGNNSWEPGNCILPFTQEEAISWLEANEKTTVLEKNFAESIKDA